MDSKLSSRLRRSEGLGGYGQKVDKKITAIHSLYILKQVAFVFNASARFALLTWAPISEEDTKCPRRA